MPAANGRDPHAQRDKYLKKLFRRNCMHKGSLHEYCAVYLLIEFMIKALHDATLEVFACIYLHLASTTTLVTPQVQSNLDEVKEREYLEAPNERVQSRHDLNKLLLAQQDLIQVLASATLCRPNSSGMPRIRCAYLELLY